MNVWCSKTGTAMVAACTTCTKIDSAPHARQRIGPHLPPMSSNPTPPSVIRLKNFPTPANLGVPDHLAPLGRLGPDVFRRPPGQAREVPLRSFRFQTNE